MCSRHRASIASCVAPVVLLSPFWAGNLLVLPCGCCQLPGTGQLSTTAPKALQDSFSNCCGARKALPQVVFLSCWVGFSLAHPGGCFQVLQRRTDGEQINNPGVHLSWGLRGARYHFGTSSRHVPGVLWWCWGTRVRGMVNQGFVSLGFPPQPQSEALLQTVPARRCAESARGNFSKSKAPPA